MCISVVDMTCRDPSSEIEVERPLVREVEVPLTFDAEFFGLLQGDVENLDALQDEEQRALVAEVGDLSKELVKLSEPSRFKKTDQYRWRELFDVYVQAGIFFSDLEKDHGKRDSVAALKRLQ